VWSFIDSFAPAVFVFETDNKAKFIVEWENIKKNESSLQFENGSIYNSFAMELSNLYFINATNNVRIYSLPLEAIKWQYQDSSSLPGTVSITFSSTEKSPINGTVSLSLSVFNQAGRGDSIPRLQYTESSNLFEVTLNNIHFTISDNKSAQAQLVSDLTFAFEGEDVATTLHESVSIDDEYTPGVFEVYIFTLDLQIDLSNIFTAFGL